MDNRDLYSYWLSVDGTDEDRKAVFKCLNAHNLIGYALSPSDAPVYSRYEVPEGVGAIDEWDEGEIDEIFHDVATIVPGATLLLEGCNETDKLTRYQKRFHGEMYQETRTVTTMAPLREDGDVPFDERFEKPAEPAEKKVYLFCEEMENDDNPRSFTVHAISDDRDALRKLLQAKVAKDEYGFIGSNGVRENSSDYFSTEYDSGSVVEYYIFEAPVMSREKTLEFLKEPEFSAEFQYPENMRSIIVKAIEECAENGNFGQVDSQKVAETIMKDVQFQAELKQAWWFGSTLSDIEADFAYRHIYSFLSEKLDDIPDYFQSVGAMPAFSPPDNLKDIMIDCIYDASKRALLPVTDPAETADFLMRNSEFRNAVSAAFPGILHLHPDTEAYRSAVCLCKTEVNSYLYEEFKDKLTGAKKKSLDALIQNAESRSGTAEKVPDSPEKRPAR